MLFYDWNVQVYQLQLSKCWKKQDALTKMQKLPNEKKSKVCNLTANKNKQVWWGYVVFTKHLCDRGTMCKGKFLCYVGVNVYTKWGMPICKASE